MCRKKQKTKQNKIVSVSKTWRWPFMLRSWSPKLIQKSLPVGLISRGTGLSLQNADCRLQTVQTEILISRNTNVSKTGRIESKTEYFCFSFDLGFQSYGTLRTEIKDFTEKKRKNSVCVVSSLQSAESAFWGDREQATREHFKQTMFILSKQSYIHRGKYNNKEYRSNRVLELFRRCLEQQGNPAEGATTRRNNRGIEMHESQPL